MRRPGLKAKIRACIRAREAGKREYKRSDELLEELIGLLKPGEEVKFDANGRKARLKDNFADANTTYRAHGIKRFELEIVD